MSKVSDIQDKIEIIQNICLRLGGNLSGIEMTANVAADEIENEGQITQETCMAMATMMKAGEDDALKLFTGLLSIHQSMARFIPEGASEGNKDWPASP